MILYHDWEVSEYISDINLFYLYFNIINNSHICGVDKQI